jgi:hypothetical protein
MVRFICKVGGVQSGQDRSLTDLNALNAFRRPSRFTDVLQCASRLRRLLFLYVPPCLVIRYVLVYFCFLLSRPPVSLRR